MLDEITSNSTDQDINKKKSLFNQYYINGKKNLYFPYSIHSRKYFGIN
jgi:hypothetical protein